MFMFIRIYFLQQICVQDFFLRIIKIPTKSQKYERLLFCRVNLISYVGLSDDNAWRDMKSPSWTILDSDYHKKYPKMSYNYITGDVFDHFSNYIKHKMKCFIRNQHTAQFDQRKKGKK